MKLVVTNVKVIKREGKNLGAKTRMYIWPAGESVLVNLLNRRSRPYVQYKKEVVPVVLELLGLSDEIKVNWSQYAGCECGCSPGFILSKSLGYDINVNVNVING